ALAARLRTGPAKQLAAEGHASWLEQLTQLDDQAAHAVREYLDAWGLRSLNYDPGSPTLQEQPAVFAGLLRDAVLDETDTRDLELRRQQAIAQAREGLPEALHEHFERVLRRAERIYPVREENVMLTDNLPGGLLRRVGLEYGRRLVARGLLDADADA